MASSFFTRIPALGMALVVSLGMAQLSASSTPGLKTAAATLQANPVLLNTLRTQLSAADFVQARATVASFSNEQMRTLLSSISIAGSGNQYLEQGRVVGSTAGKGLVATLGVAGLLAGAYFLTFADNAKQIRRCFGFVERTIREVPVPGKHWEKQYIKEYKFNPVGGLLAYGATILVASFLAIGCHGLYKDYEVNTLVHSLMHDVALFTTQAMAVAKLIEQSPALLTALPSLQALQQPLNVTGEQAEKLATLLASNTLQDNPGTYSLRGRAYAACALMLELQNGYAASMQALDELTNAVSLATLS